MIRPPNNNDSDIMTLDSNNEMTTNILNSDSDSASSESRYSLHDSSTGPFLKSDSATETFCESDIKEEIENNKFDGIEIGEYVMVKFLAGKVYRYYIGLITGYNPEEIIYTTKYLRKNTKGISSWPLVDDVSEITLLDIEKILPKPQVGRRGRLIFNIKFHVPMADIN